MFYIQPEGHHKFPAAGRCHDCGVPSRTYRCDTCKCIFLKDYDDYTVGLVTCGEQSLTGIFKGIRRDRIARGYTDNL